MKFVEDLFGPHPVLTRKRVWLAMSIAVIIDGLQFGLGPFGWAFIDEGLDVLGMIVISWIVGFHMLLLPTFVVELIPGPDMLPTWTGCTAAVILLRKRANRRQAPPPIEVTSEVTPVPAQQPGAAAATPNPACSPPPRLSNPG